MIDGEKMYKMKSELEARQKMNKILLKVIKKLKIKEGPSSVRRRKIRNQLGVSNKTYNFLNETMERHKDRLNQSAI